MRTCYLFRLAFPAVAIGLIVGCSRSEPSATAATGAPAAAKSGAASAGQNAFTDTQVLEAFGWMVGSDMGIFEMGMSDAQFTAWSRGFQAALQGKNPPFDLDSIGPSMSAKYMELANTRLQKLLTANRTASTDYFANLKGASGVVELPSGLRYEVLEPGTGATPKATDTVRVNYEGRFIDGEVFDSSIERGTPAEFALTEVIPGWTEGLQHVRKGGKIRLHVPSGLAYGDEGRPGMPPGATLIFEISLLDIVSNTPAAAPATK